MTQVRDSRDPTHVVDVAGVKIGGDHPIVVQAMTNTPTADIVATAAQVVELALAGAELVRVSVDTPEAARAVSELRARVSDAGVDVPLVGDFHYNGHRLLRQFPQLIEALAKIRINPGNVNSSKGGSGKGGSGKKSLDDEGPATDHDGENFQTMVAIARDAGKAVRIGVNWGSLDQDLLRAMMDENAKRTTPKTARDVMIDVIVMSALRSAEAAEGLGLAADRIILSAKVSVARDLAEIYERLAATSRYALHLGLTEAGPAPRGIVASSAALAPLLVQGIGDTIRISLTPAPGASRVEEVAVARQLLQSLGLRAFSPTVTACPGCGRTTSTRFLELAEKVDAHLQLRSAAWVARDPDVAHLRVAVMGCVVNGPGESKHADIGISLPGTAEGSKAVVYVDGAWHRALEGPNLADDFLALIDGYVEQRLGGEGWTTWDSKIVR